MTTKNLGPAISGYLNPEGRAFETVVLQAGKAILDKELNLLEDIDVGAGQLALTSAMPSGWVSTDYLDSSNDVGAIFTASAAVLQWNAPIMTAHVNGWMIKVTNTGVIGPNRLSLTTGPSGAGAKRSDIVVLEVWRKLLSASPSTDGKSPTGRIWANGNVKVASGDDAAINFPDDILDSNLGVESTKRVQIQYRLRLVPGVDLLAYPAGIDDPSVVARSVPASAAAPDGNVTAFTYANQSAVGDGGLWRAGDGNPANTLGTVDGYMYAIPLCGFFRRNTTAFAKNTNQNGGVVSPGPSTRPDGLFVDVLVADDVIDLRRGVRPDGWDYNEILDKTVNLLFDNTLKTEGILTSIGGGTVGHTFLWANEIGVLPGDGVTTGDTPGADFVGQFDAGRRYYSDRPILETITVKLIPGANWIVGTTVSVQPSALEIYPYAPADFAARAPAEVMFMDITNASWIGSGGTKKTANAMANLTKVTGLGTRPIGAVAITVGGTLPTGLTDEPLYVDILVAYPGGGGLSYTPVLDFGTASVSVNDPLAMPASSPVNFSAYTHALDWPHREIRLTYTTTTVTFNCNADTTIAALNTFRIAERANSLVAVRRNGGALVGSASLDSTGRIITLNNAADYTSPGDTLSVDYVAIRPFPDNGEQVTIWYDTRAPQTIRSSILGTTITLIPRAVSSHLWVMAVGSGSQDEAYPFPYQYVQTAGVYPTSTGSFAGEHEMMATATIDIATFNADTGLLKLPVLVPYVPPPETVTFNRSSGDADAEGRTFFKSVPVGYIPNAYAQELSDAKKHKVILPMLAELAVDSNVGRKGQLLIVLLQRWVPFDEENFVAFTSDLTLNTTTASVFRLKGHLLNKRA